MLVYSRGRSLRRVYKVCKKLLWKVTGDNVVGLPGRAVDLLEVDGEVCAVDLIWSGSLFLLGQGPENGTQLGFPGHGLYLDGANRRQQMSQGAYAMGKSVIKIMGHGDQVKFSK